MPTEAEVRAPMSSIGVVISEAVVTVLEEVQFAVPVSIESNLGMLIRSVQFNQDGLGAAAPPGADSMTNTRESDVALSLVQGLATIPTLQDPRTLCAMHVLLGAGTAAGDTGISQSIAVWGDTWDFGPGILVMDPTLSLYLISSTLTSSSTVRMRLHYQLIKVTAQEAISFAVRSLG